MNHTNLGHIGLKVSRLCLGTMTYGSKSWRDWILDEDEARPFFRRAVKAGKALYIGASSMYVWQFARMLHAAERNGWTRFVSMQPHYNLIYREEEREMIPLCLAEGVGVIPWSPLARGFLAGNRTREKK